VDLENDQSDLKNVGLKATFPRLKILDIFRKSDERHLSAEDVYRSLIAEHIDLNKPGFSPGVNSMGASRFSS
jgi:Fur family transcriptional regulator, ferric uptake regulator